MTTTFTPTTITTKFQRTYQLEIQPIITGNPNIIVGSLDGSQPLLTLEFNINRNNLSSINTGDIRIKNLNSSSRNTIFKDFYNQLIWRSVVLKAGYAGTPLSIIFNGKAQTIYSYREEGGTDWITQIQGADFSQLFANSFSSWTEGNGSNAYTQKNVITHTITDMQNYAKDNGQTLGIGAVQGFNDARYTYTANDFSMNILGYETARNVFIDNASIFALPSNCAFEGPVTLISSQTGLLGTPKISGIYVIAQMMFEPSMSPGQWVYLDTELAEFNSLNQGAYKVVGVQHAGIISSTMPGKCITTVQLYYVKNLNKIQMGLYPSQ